MGVNRCLDKKRLEAIRSETLHGVQGVPSSNLGAPTNFRIIPVQNSIVCQELSNRRHPLGFAAAGCNVVLSGCLYVLVIQQLLGSFLIRSAPGPTIAEISTTGIAGQVATLWSNTSYSKQLELCLDIAASDCSGTTIPGAAGLKGGMAAVSDASVPDRADRRRDCVDSRVLQRKFLDSSLIRAALLSAVCHARRPLLPPSPF